MRVEINFGGDSHDAVISSEEIVKALRGVFRAGAETGQVLDEVKISAGQAAETSASARRMAQSVEQIGQEARRSRRELEQLKLAQAGVGGGFGGILPGGARPRTAAYALLGTLGAAVSGPAGIGAAGGLAALPGLATAGVAAIGVLVASFHGMGKAIEGDRQAFEALDPSAQKFTQTIRSLIPWAKELQQTARQGLLPGLDQALHEAINPQTAAATETAVRGISSALGDVSVQLGKTLGGPLGQRFLGDLGTHGVVQIRNVGDATDHWAQALLTLTHAGQPLADWLTKIDDDAAKYVDTFLQAQEATGGLSRFMHSAQDELRIAGQFLGALAHAAGSLAFDLTPLGNEILVDVTHALQNLANWLDRNRTEVNDFTTGALHALVSTLRTAWPIAMKLADALKQLVDDVGGWENAFKIIIDGSLAYGFVSLGLKIAGVGVAAEGATAQVGLLRGALLGLNGPQVIAALAAVALAVNEIQNGKNGILSQAITGAIGAAGIGGGDTSLPTYQQWRSSKGSARAAIESAMRAGGISNPAALPGGPRYVAPAGGGAGAGRIPAPLGGNDFRTANLGGETSSTAVGRQKLLAFARSAIGTPYVWGGSGPGGFDCSGLVMWAFANGLDISLPHFSGDQFNKATPIKRSQLQPGDVVFTEFDKHGVPQHEGLYAGGNKVIEAPHTGDKVKQISLDSFVAGQSRVAYGSFIADQTTKSPFRVPPPFGDDKGANLLPASLRKAMAIAQTTPGAADDRSAIQAAIKYLRSTVGDLTGEDQINAYLELASLLGQLKMLAPKVKKKAGPASRASRISAHGEAVGLLSALGSDPFADATAQPQSLESAMNHLRAVRRALTPEIQAIDKELRDKTLSARTLATLRAQMAQYKKTIGSALTDVRSAIERRKDEFRAAWEQIGQAAIDALEKKRGEKTPSELLLEKITGEHDQKQLTDALDAANKQLADALKGHIEDPEGVVQRAREYVGKALLSNAIDDSQSAILGGLGQHISGDQVLSDLQKILVQNTVVDEEEVKQAQSAVDEAQYNIRVRDLGVMADAERAARDDLIDREEEAIRTRTDNWEKFFRMLHGNIGAISADWNTFLGGFGAGPNGFGLGAAGNTVYPVDKNNVPSGAGFYGFDDNGNYVGTPGDLQTLIDASKAANPNAAGANGTPFQGPAQVDPLHALGIPGFAGGGDFMVDSPTVFAAGEAGREHVKITPARAGASGGGGLGGDVVVNVHGNIPRDWINVEIDRSTARISRNLGDRTAKRLRAGRF